MGHVRGRWLGWAGLASLGLTGCGGNSAAIDNLPVKSASLSNIAWNGVDVVGGISWTAATLTIVDTSNVAHSVAVDLSGPDLGFLFDFEAQSFGASLSLTLPAGKQLTGKDLVGSYFGKKVSGHLVIGGASRDLSNSAGVKLSGGSYSFGLGLMVGGEWLDLSVR